MDWHFVSSQWILSILLDEVLSNFSIWQSKLLDTYWLNTCYGSLYIYIYIYIYICNHSTCLRSKHLEMYWKVHPLLLSISIIICLIVSAAWRVDTVIPESMSLKQQTRLNVGGHCPLSLLLITSQEVKEADTWDCALMISGSKPTAKHCNLQLF